MRNLLLMGTQCPLGFLVVVVFVSEVSRLLLSILYPPLTFVKYTRLPKP
ncbi:hypothetical protein AA0111_g858 [Alternaria arborescens]|nr:hypothetical protein AA0111_g858 [Alternaria arborescens]RYO41436.1 hypothetical protein AA0111_g858 [Alternaria arborescens]